MSTITEKIPRSLAKVVTWRIIMIMQYFAIGYYTTGSVAFGAALAGFTTVVNSLLYFTHERLWNKTDWDRQVASKESTAA
jgi:uncharacterized membrane protein